LSRSIFLNFHHRSRKKKCFMFRLITTYTHPRHARVRRNEKDSEAFVNANYLISIKFRHNLSLMGRWGWVDELHEAYKSDTLFTRWCSLASDGIVRREKKSNFLRAFLRGVKMGFVGWKKYFWGEFFHNHRFNYQKLLAHKNGKIKFFINEGSKWRGRRK
jgi:hypothetical protein